MSSKILGPKGRTAPKFDDNDHDSLISRFPILTTPNDWNHVVFLKSQYAQNASLVAF